MKTEREKPIKVTIDDLVKNIKKYEQQRIHVIDGWVEKNSQEKKGFILTTYTSHRNSTNKEWTENGIVHKKKKISLQVQTPTNTRNFEEILFYLQSAQGIRDLGPRFKSKDNIIIDYKGSEYYRFTKKGSVGRVLKETNKSPHKRFYKVKFLTLTGMKTKQKVFDDINAKSMKLIRKNTTKQKEEPPIMSFIGEIKYFDKEKQYKLIYESLISKNYEVKVVRG